MKVKIFKYFWSISSVLFKNTLKPNCICKIQQRPKKGELPLSCQILHQHRYSAYKYCILKTVLNFEKLLTTTWRPWLCRTSWWGLCHSFNFSTCSFCWKKDRDTFAFLFEPKKATEPLRAAGGSAQARAHSKLLPKPYMISATFSCWASKQWAVLFSVRLLLVVLGKWAGIAGP